MLKHIKAVIAAGAVSVLLSGAGFLAAGTAQAAPSVAKISNGPTGPGEAGYFTNDNGQTRFRDVQFTTTVTNTLENLNGSGAPGGIGGELCDENTGFAAQIGLEWPACCNPVVEYNYTGNPGYDAVGGGYLTASFGQADQDPCVEGGLINAGAGEMFANGITVKQGDVVHFEIYYDPQGHWAYSPATGWAWLHQVKFLVSDLTQGLTRVQYVKVPSQNFHEAGIGIVSMANVLTGGAVNLVNTFSGAFFNWYNNGYGARWAPQGIVQPSHWDLEYANFVNASNQVTITPSALSADAKSFTMLEGSTSA